MASAQQYSFDSPSQMDRRDRDEGHLQPQVAAQAQAQSRSALAQPPFKRMMSGNSMVAAGAHNQANMNSDGGQGKAHKPSALSNDLGAASTTPAPPAHPTGSTAQTHTGVARTGEQGQPAQTAAEAAAASVSASASASAKESADRAAKSFRVTLDDPCWKVLPAALKKYKINDDWKLYALFICFGNTGELRGIMTRRPAADAKNAV
jgi:hypothetical protein